MRRVSLRLLSIAFLIFGFASLNAGQPAAEPGLQAPQEVEFKAKVDGLLEKYAELLPVGYDAGKKYDLIIALHGHGADRWQYAKDPRDECRGARDVAARHGMIFISPDYRAATSWMGPKAEADLVQIIGKLKKERKIGRVFLVGASMGGTSVLIFAALHPELVAGVSSQNPTANMVEYANFQDAIAASYGGDKKQKPEEYKKRSSELAYKKFAGLPVAITTGGKDSLVPPESALRLAEKLKQLNPGKTLLMHRPEGGHSTDYKDTVKALEFVIDGVSGGKAKSK